MTITLLDGGMGRELARIGAPFRQPEWSALALIEGPEYVERAHDAFIAAGADGTARFGAEGFRLADLAGRLAREAAARASRSVRVAASLPPVCGSYRADWFDAREARPILTTLVAGLGAHADIWLAETLSSIGEAQLVREVLGEDPRPLWLSFTIADEAAEPGRPRLRSGQPLEDAAAAAMALGAEALLFNCSQPEVMADAVAAARAVVETEGARLTLGVYANAFPPQTEAAAANAGLDEIRRDLTPEAYLAFAQTWRALGADIIGGCCGVGPEHIAGLRAAMEPEAAA